MADEQAKAALTKTRGEQAAKMPHEQAKEYVKASADMDKDYNQTAQATSATGNAQTRQELMGSFKKGGVVPKTGPYKLHKGEKVIPAKKENEMKKKVTDAATAGLAGKPEKATRPKKTTHTNIEPTDNKGFIVNHEEHENGMPTGKKKRHVFTKASDMHKHIVKMYPAPASEVAEAAPTAPAAPAAAAPPAAEPAEV